MKRLIIPLSLLTSVHYSAISQVLYLDSIEYTINLEKLENAYLKLAVNELLIGYCEGKYHAYYPKFDRIEVLHHDFMTHYDRYYMNTNDDFCWEGFCRDPEIMQFYNSFSKKIGVKEYVYMNQQKNIIQRDIAWVQLYYEGIDNTGVEKIFPSIKFWLREVGNDVQIFHKNFGKMYTLQQVFDYSFFIKNEQNLQPQRQKVIYHDDYEDH